MDALKYFIIGFLFIYAIQILDIIMQLIGAYASVIATKYQVKIEKLGGGDYEVKEPLFGFQYEPYEEDDEELAGDYVDKK